MMRLTQDGSFVQEVVRSFLASRIRNRRGYGARDLVEGLEGRRLLVSQPAFPLPATEMNHVAVLLLNPSGTNALSASGNAVVSANNGGSIIVDSHSATAVRLSGNARVVAESIHVTGGTATSGKATFSGKIDHPLPTPDPLAVPLPTAPATMFGRVNYANSALLTLSPGTYVGGINVTGEGKVKLNPGIYYLQGGGLHVSGNGTLTGSGVLLVNVPAAANDGDVAVSGKGAVSLTSPTGLTGVLASYNGLAFLQDPASTSPITFSSQGAVTLGGSLYAPQAALSVTGAGGLTVTPGPVVVRDLIVSGSGKVTVNPHAKAPAIRAALSNDTGVSGNDAVTHDDTVRGSLTASDWPMARLRAGFNTTAAADFVDVTSALSSDRTFVLPPAVLNAVFGGGVLPDGQHTLHLQASDSLVNKSPVLSLPFTLDTAAPAITITTPAADRTNHNIKLTGRITDTLSGASSLRLSVDDGSAADVALDASGTFTYTTSLPLNGMSDGIHVLRLTGSDKAGNTGGPADYSFRLDTTPPQVTLALDPASDTEPLGDNKTAFATVTLVGTTEPGLSVRLSSTGATTTATPDGIFRFLDVPLAVGVNAVTATATDAAGNSSSAIQTVTREKPLITIDASLANDTGVSASDSLTYDNTVRGTVTASDRSLVKLRAGFDDMPPAAFVDVSSALAADLTFVLSTAALNNVFGGVLPQGAHVLHIQGGDSRFADAPFFDLPFTLDTIAPVAPAFSLDVASDSAPVGDKSTTFRAVGLVGTTEPESTVVDGSGTSAKATNDGAFRLRGVLLDAGANTLALTATDAAGNSSTAADTLTRVRPNTANQVALDWNAATLNAIVKDASAPPIASRSLAIVSAAMYDAVNSINGASSSLYVRIASPAGSSDLAAVAQAAHDALTYLYPSQQATFDSQLQTSLAAVPDGASKDHGVAVGQQVAAAIITQRKNDGAIDFVEYTPGAGHGVWQPTYPMYAVALLPNFATLKPFIMTSGDQFRPIGPTLLDSTQWVTEYNEVKALGSATSTTRTAEQTQIARFWADGAGTVTPAGHWNQIATQLLAAQGNANLSDTTRLLAQLNVALGDAAIVAWDAKYADNFWRPITAIHAGGGNASLAADKNWVPLLNTPNFPEYVSGHSTFSGAAAVILANHFGDNVAFGTTSPSPGVAGVVRNYSSFTAAAQEAGVSRIYGGIHFMTSNLDGQAAGAALGAYVLQRFGDLSDDSAPSVSYDGTQGQAAKANFNVTGLVTDNLSGVKSLVAQMDEGSLFDVSIDASGRFSVATGFALDGTADGPHTLHLTAKDFTNNTSASIDYSFTLDTVAPLIDLTTPIALSAGDEVAGSASGTGSELVALSYKFDDGIRIPVLFNTADGSFAETLDVSKLDAGAHVLSVFATDAAGNVATTDLDVTLSNRIALTVSHFTPSSSASDVGATYRPKITFSRPIDPATLNSDNFFATDSTGARIPATVIPANDGTYAWLFFGNALAGSSTVRVTVKGSSIKAADGTLLDAAGSGIPGSELTWTFSTVSTAPSAGTTLSGTIADPGPDLKPGTPDDVSVGADGVLMTADDVYKLPIAGVHVSVAGMNLSTITDAQGRFSLGSAPIGNVKLIVDGNTASNSPPDFYFPDMVMDLQLLNGEANTVMAAMARSGTGNAPQGAALPDAPGIYLPRLRTTLLQTVNNGDDTHITVSADNAANLTADQRAHLTMDIPAGSMIGPDGNSLDSAQVGISTVPPELVMEMLPPGVLQHSFDITIQAPGVAAFTQPLPMTFPNLQNALPGTKLNFLSYDHASGRLQIEGTATVSDDGSVVRTDPGSGVTHPGWHFVAQGSVNKDTFKQPDLESKSQFNRLDLLRDEYPECFALPGALELCIAAAKTAVNGAVTYFNGTFQFNSADFLSHFLGSGSFDIVRVIDAIKSDDAFKNMVRDDVQSIKAQIASKEPGDPLDLELPAVTFAPSSADLGNTFGHGMLPIIEASAEGDASEDGASVTGTLNYKVRFTYGYGKDNARRSYFMRQARLLQLAGEAQPFTIEFTIKQEFSDNASEVHQRLTRTTDARAAFAAPMSVASHSTAVGFGSDPAVYYRFALSNGFEIAGRTGASGSLDGIVFPANAEYTGSLYAPSVNRWVSIKGTSGRSGATFGLAGTKSNQIVVGDPSTVELVRFGGKDSDSDGLPDAGEYVLGTDTTNPDTDGDGISDAAAIAQGQDPLSARTLPTGVIGSVSLQGIPQAISVERSTTAGGQQVAFVATGNHGMAVVDVSSPQRPVVLSQLSLSGGTGMATDVSVDPTVSRAAVADNAGGLIVINVADPSRPVIDYSLNINASHVEVFEGVVYAAAGGEILSFDLLSGDMLGTCPVSSNAIRGIAREDSMLYAIDAIGVLRAVEINGPSMVVRGSLSIPGGGGNLFAGGSVVYVPIVNRNSGGFTMSSGFVTIDVSDVDHLATIGGLDGAVLGGAAIRANGSGLGISIGSFKGLPGGVVDVLNLTNLADTGDLLARISLNSIPSDVAIASGIAYTIGSQGLEIVNYVPFDKRGVAPVVTVDIGDLDIDPTTAGIQVAEGSNVSFRAIVGDDVQVRNVELLLNGAVVRNDISFPFDLRTVAPLISAGSTTATLQARATDTGGNISTSAPLTLELVSDPVAPRLLRSNPSAGEVRGLNFRSIALTFSEPMAEPTVTLTAFPLASPTGEILLPERVEVRDGGSRVQLTYPNLGQAGAWRLSINTGLTDRAGNSVESVPTVDFTIGGQIATWVNPRGGLWEDPTNWDTGAVPGPGDKVLIDVPGGATITYESGDTEIGSLLSNNPLKITGGTLTVSGNVQVNNSFTLDGGTLRNATMLPGSSGQKLIIRAGTLDGVTADADLDLTAGFVYAEVLNGLTLNGTATLGLAAQLLFSGGSQTLGGNGTVVFMNRSLNGLIANADDMTLTIGPGITVRGGGSPNSNAGVIGDSQGGIGPITFASNTSIVNQGTIIADTSALSITVRPSGGTFVNQGTLRSEGGGNLVLSGMRTLADLGTIIRAGGTVTLTGTLDNMGRTLALDTFFSQFTVNGLTVLGGTVTTSNGDASTLPSGAKLILDGANLVVPVAVPKGTTLTLQGSWSNAGGLSLIGGVLNLGGTFNLIRLGSLTRTDGIVNLTGTLDLAGGTLALNAATGSWTLAGGTIQNGTVTAASGSKLAFASGGTLDGVTVDADLELTAGFVYAEVRNGLTLNGKATLGRFGQLLFSGGSQTLGGSGAVVFLDEPVNGLIANADNMTLTIGSGITIRGGSQKPHGGIIGLSEQGVGPIRFAHNTSIVNLGTIIADGAGLSITIRPNGGTFVNQGTLRAENGGNLVLGGTYALAGLGTIIGGGGRVTLGGTLNNTDGVLALDTLFNQFAVTGLTILGGTVTTNDGQAFTLPSGAILTLDRTDLAVPVVVPTGATLNLDGTLTLARLGSVNSGGGAVNLTGTLDLAGGTLTLNAATGSWNLKGGTILNGTVVGADGAQLSMMDGAVLDRVTLASDAIFGDGTIMIRNGLALANEATLTVGPDHDTFNFVAMIFEGSQTLSGTGTIRLRSNAMGYYAFLQLNSDETLTIGSGITIRGESPAFGDFDDIIINNGTIIADVPGRELHIAVASFENNGILREENGGQLIINGAPLNA